MFKSDEEENDIEVQGNSSIHSAAIKTQKKSGAGTRISHCGI